MRNTVNIQANKAMLHEDCTVLINLSGPGNGGQRISVNETLTLRELGVSLINDAAQKPEFPSDKIAAINTNQGLTPDQKKAQLNAAISDYEKAVASFQQAGGMAIEDQIVVAAVEYLVSHKGFSKTDQPNKPVIKANELQVTAVPTRSGELLFTVNGTSVWG